MLYWITIVAAAAVGVVLPFVSPASAHHVMGGELPSTAWHGLLSGLGHPIIGIDHLAFIVGVGLMAHLAGRVALLPLLFVAGTVLGCFMHIQGHDLPLSELLIAVTIVVAAGIIGTLARIPIVILGSMFVLAGVFHGYAYGESIVGVETTPLVAYMIGFGVIQYGIAVASGDCSPYDRWASQCQRNNGHAAGGRRHGLVAAVVLVNIALVG